MTGFSASWRLLFWLLVPAAVVFGVHWVLRGLPPPQESGELVVLTRQSPTTYYLEADGRPAGFEHDLVADFARRNGWTVRWKVADSVAGLIWRITAGEAHLAAAGLTITPERSRRLNFGPPYQEEREQVVCGPLAAMPSTVADLKGLRVEVVKASSHAEHLQGELAGNAGLVWVEVEGKSTEELLERANLGLSDCTVADSVTFAVSRNYLPDLRAAFDLGAPRRFGWMLPKRADPRLLQAVETYFAEVTAQGLLARLGERYFGHVERLAEADVRGILEKRTRLLPKFKAHFLEAQAQTGVDWRLLAALAYQESHWDALARSPTGVRGLMMLTGETADRLGVRNRLDPKESILGGARYLAMLRDEIPVLVPEPDRTWMALAAYNVGMGHLEDARRLAERLGKDPNAWQDVKDVLPYLAKPSYRRMLRLGYARGGEARTLAENVRIFYDILARFEQPEGTLGAPGGLADTASAQFRGSLR